MLISLGKCFKSNAVPKIFTVDTKKMLKRRQQRIMMQKICTEDKKSAQQDLLHYFNILSFGISLEMVGGSRILFMLPF
jgi:carbamoylphosphate synthase small subunit